MDIYLREVTKDDMDLLFRWANDPLVRKNAFHTEQIPYEDHVKWFHRMLGNDKVYPYILCRDGQPVGQIRLDIQDDLATIDYSIAPELRGMGLGSCMLTLIEKKVSEEITHVTKIIGQVKYENTASARAFEKCGYSRIDKKDYIEYERILRA